MIKCILRDLVSLPSSTSVGSHTVERIHSLFCGILVSKLLLIEGGIESFIVCVDMLGILEALGSESWSTEICINIDSR